MTLRPCETDEVTPADTSDDDWLLDEVLEAFEDLAREPSDLEAALERAYERLEEVAGLSAGPE